MQEDVPCGGKPPDDLILPLRGIFCKQIEHTDCENFMGEFLQAHYHVKDIALKELSLPFITDYETFLRTDKHLKINSAMVFVGSEKSLVVCDKRQR